MKHQSEILKNIPNIHHGFYTRKGGVSKGIYAGRNCGLGSQDDKEAVLQNRQQVAQDMDIKSVENLLTAYQIHSNDVLSVRRPLFDFTTPPKADAMITDQADIGLGILTADCAPVLFASHDGKMVAAAHAGWRGAYAGILPRTLEKFIVAGYMPEEISIAIGPAIGQPSYEVDMNFLSQFLLQSSTNEEFFKPAERKDHFLFDLGGYIVHQLKSLGVIHIDLLGLDTYKRGEEFFSFRRSTHNGETDYGRQISVIAIKANETDK